MCGQLAPAKFSGQQIIGVRQDRNLRVFPLILVYPVQLLQYVICVAVPKKHIGCFLQVREEKLTDVSILSAVLEAVAKFCPETG